MKAFVTGGTGLIGRAVVERLLRRGVDVVLMLREGAADARSEELGALRTVAIEAGAELHDVEGDLLRPNLGLSKSGRAHLSAASHFFHFAALYDLDAPGDAANAVNVEGTAHLLEALAAARFSGCLHHTSSIAVAGDYKGRFTEAMFDEGQRFPHPYHQSKYDSEALVRRSAFQYKIYRPSSVVGDSRTGAIDRIDGIYLGMQAVLKLAATVPSWVRVPVPRIRGSFNVVPVDYVADAVVHIAFSSTGEQVFHIVDPDPPSFMRLIRTMVRAAGGPRIGPAIDITKLPALKNTGAMLASLPSVAELWDALLEDVGLPTGALGAMNLAVTFDSANTEAALHGSEITCPPFAEYAKALYRYYEDHLDPRARRPERYRRALAGKVVLVTGASRGIGAETARVAARAGATVLLVARGADSLKKVAAQIRAEGGDASTYPRDLSVYEEVDALATEVLADHGGVDVLIHNAARSIRRTVADAADRFHDYERTMGLNYFSPVRLTLRLLPSLRERSGTVSHVVTMGVLVPGPYFSAYLASKSALDAFGDTLAGELHHEGLHVSSVYLPLVKTEMMAPTKEYEGRRDALTPYDAAVMILDGVVDRKRRVFTTSGALFGFSNRIAPTLTTRVLNLIQRTFPTGDADSEFPLERAIITKAIGGSPI